MITKKGKIPVNARVDIDYSQEKPKIKFSYTSKNPKKDAVSQNKFIIILSLFIFFTFIFYLILYFYPLNNTYPEYCNVTLNESHYNYSSNYEIYNNGNYSNHSFNYTFNRVLGADFICDNGNYSLEFKPQLNLRDLPSNFYQNNKMNFLSNYGIFVCILLAILISYPITKWLVKKKWYQEWIPKHNAGRKNKRKKYYKFKSKDVLENVVIIPKFQNVELIYKTDGDFSKYLNKIKIREYRHYKYRKQKVGKLEVDNFTWYAIFYFKQTPKNGYLEVIYQ